MGGGRRRTACRGLVIASPGRGRPGKRPEALSHTPGPRTAVRAWGEQSGRRDSNSGPHRPERCALPGCATPRCTQEYPTHGRGRYLRPMPADLSEILAELERLLEPGRFEDYCVNGLQVPGPATHREDRRRASRRTSTLFERAAAERADLLLVHHGLFWGRRRQRRSTRRSPGACGSCSRTASRWPPSTCRSTRTRELGNNALLARALSGDGPAAVRTRTADEPIGFIARLPGDGLALEDLLRAGRGTSPRREPAALRRRPRARPRASRSSRAPAPTTCGQAREAGADALLTGEVSERSPADAARGGPASDRRRAPRDGDTRHQGARRASRRALRHRARLHRRVQHRADSCAQPALQRLRSRASFAV